MVVVAKNEKTTTHILKSPNAHQIVYLVSCIVLFLAFLYFYVFFIFLRFLFCMSVSCILYFSPPNYESLHAAARLHISFFLSSLPAACLITCLTFTSDEDDDAY